MSLYNFYRSDNWLNLLKVLKLQRVDTNGNIICEYCGKPIVRAYDYHVRLARTQCPPCADSRFNRHSIIEIKGGA